MLPPTVRGQPPGPSRAGVTSADFRKFDSKEAKQRQSIPADGFVDTLTSATSYLIVKMLSALGGALQVLRPLCGHSFCLPISKGHVCPSVCCSEKVPAVSLQTPVTWGINCPTLHVRLCLLPTLIPKPPGRRRWNEVVESQEEGKDSPNTMGSAGHTFKP